jgi:hypothetical protein
MEDTYPAEGEGERQDKLRENTSFDTDAKSEDDVDSMHPDSWAGGSVVPDAKEVARGEAPANRTQRTDRLPEPAEFDMSTEETRPWAPTNPETEPSDTDAAGRERNPMSDLEPRQAPPTEPAHQPEPQSDRPSISKPGAFQS